MNLDFDYSFNTLVRTPTALFSESQPKPASQDAAPLQHFNVWHTAIDPYRNRKDFAFYEVLNLPGDPAVGIDKEPGARAQSLRVADVPQFWRFADDPNAAPRNWINKDAG